MNKETVLGKMVNYPQQLDASLLFPIPRIEKRQELGIESPVLPFRGIDIWNAYEISWLNNRGKPQVAVGEFHFPCSSQYLIESKSFKLYLNSFNQSNFPSIEQIRLRLIEDLSKACGETIDVFLNSGANLTQVEITSFTGEELDELDIEIDTYDYHPEFLQYSTNEKIVEESLVSHLLKSNCLVTGQPDWASIQIKYQGKQINREALLKYLISFRQHNEFHEQCVERIYMDIMKYCQPEYLSVYARYTRRGGLDINPYRANYSSQIDNGNIVNLRLIRQ